MESSANPALCRSDRPSLISAADLSMTRDTLFTAAGRPRASSPNNPLPPDVTVLMAQQIALLQEQTALLRAQTSFLSDNRRPVCSRVRNRSSIPLTPVCDLSYKSGDMVSAKTWDIGLRTPSLHKYSKIIGNGDVMKQFQEESASSSGPNITKQLQSQWVTSIRRWMPTCSMTSMPHGFHFDATMHLSVKAS